MKLLYFLTISAFLGTIALSLLAPVEALYLEKLTVNYSLIGLALGISSISAILFSPMLGKFSDRVGRKKIILSFAFLGSFIPLLLVLSPNIESYILIKFLAGILGTSWAVSFALIGDIVEKSAKKGFAFGIYIMGSSLGSALGSLISGYVASFVGDLSTPYFLAFFISFISFLLLLPLVKYKEIISKKAKSKGKRVSSLKNIPIIIVAVIILSFLFSFHMSMKGLLWPYILKNFVEVELVPFYVAITFASMGILAGLLSPLVGKLGDKLGFVRIFFLGYFIMGIFGILLAFSNSFFLFYLFSVLYAFGEILKGPTSDAIITEYTKKENRGFIFGVLSSIGGIASFLGPTFTGFLLNFLNWNYILFIYGLAILASTLVFGYLIKFKLPLKSH